MKPLRIGVINWDSALPPETYFGHYMLRSLSPDRYRSRLPFYTERKEDGSVTFHYRTPEEFDRELEYAAQAGIDYFAHTWYTEEALGEGDPQAGDVDSVVWELNYARKLHQKSALARKIGFCAILLTGHAYTDADFRKLAEAMKQDGYEKLGGRPLLYLFGGYREGVALRAEKAASAIGLPKPFTVFMDNGPSDADPQKADAVSNYACTNRCPVQDYTGLYEELLLQNEERRKYGIPVIPQFTMGWDPSPRCDSPVPWTPYLKQSFASRMTESEVLRGAERLAGWISEHPEQTGTGHVLTFAWNEFEEGGYICPTLGKNGEPDMTRLALFRKVVDILSRESE